jgi:hypothetical protein
MHKEKPLGKGGTLYRISAEFSIRLDRPRIHGPIAF